MNDRDYTAETLHWLRQPLGGDLRPEFRHWDDTQCLDRPVFTAAGSTLSGGTYQASRLARASEM
jgi:hypothetical protein